MDNEQRTTTPPQGRPLQDIVTDHILDEMTGALDDALSDRFEFSGAYNNGQAVSL